MDILAIFDNNTSLLAAQFAAGVAGTYTSSNSYDNQATGSPLPAVVDAGTTFVIGGPLLHDLGRGIKLKFFAQITAAVTSAGAATIQIGLITDDTNADLSTGTVLMQSLAIAKAALVQGYRFRFGSTPHALKRFTGAQVIIGTAALTAGSYTAGLVADMDDHYDTLG